MNVVRINNVGRKFNNFIDHQYDPAEKKRPAHGGSSFWAIRNIYLTIEQGEIVGIIGRNGSGKSTLLNVIAGGLAPSEGEILVEGRVSGLLALGAGFHDEFTGKENIYLSASLLGLARKDTERVYQDIVEFSELGEFINAPLGSYSGGMKMRLGFSVAIHKDFDILVTDEVIGVGDMGFQKKCFERMVDFKRQGKSMVIASQDIAVVQRLCDRVILLEDGRVIAEGEPQKVAEQYLMLVSKRKVLSESTRSYVSAHANLWRDASAEVSVKEQDTTEVVITSVKVFNRWGQEVREAKPGEEIRVKAEFSARTPLDGYYFGISLFREDGVCCYGSDTQKDGLGIPPMGKGEGSFELVCEHFSCMPGTYYATAAVWEKNSSLAFTAHKSQRGLEIIGNTRAEGYLVYLASKWNNAFLSGLADRRLSPHLEHLADLWEKEDASCGVRIAHISFLNAYAAREKVFPMERELRIKVDFTAERSSRARVPEAVLWVGIYREDGIYCHGSIKRVTLSGAQTEVVSYPKVPLLPGAYRVSAGIWDPGAKRFLAYTHGCCGFHMISDKRDQGTVYLAHHWKWNVPLVSEEVRSRRIPQGDAVVPRILA